MLSCTRSRLLPGQEFPTPARLNERLPGLAPVLLKELSPFPPRRDLTPALYHYGLCLRLQTVGMSLSPCLRSSALDRIAGLLALETSDLQRQPLSVGLLDEASIEHGQATLVASGSTSRHRGGWFTPASFHLVGSQTIPVDAVHPNNVS